MLTVRHSEGAALRQELLTLEREFADKRREVESFQLELGRLQARYLGELGEYYAELASLAEGAEEEPEVAERDGGDGGDPACNRSAPSVDLKKMYRDIAKAIHPDKAHNSAARDRRHSLMAEANKAFANRDTDRLLLILRHWERSPDSVPGDDPEAAHVRLQRRVAELREQLLELDIEMADLQRSSIARLKQRSDEAREQGWDLFVEMKRQVKREIANAKKIRAGLAR